MSSFVVDTNVAVAANGAAEQAGPACVLACVAALEAIRDAGKIVLDDRMLILREYLGAVGLAGRPGPGRAFVKWVFDNQGVSDRCERVPVEPIDDSFAQFPQDPTLAGFHRKDRVFVAVALASTSRPAVLNAVDSDWWDYREALAAHGVRVQFVCPEQFAKRA